MNHEHYPDPTAEDTISLAKKKEHKKIDELNSNVIKSFRELADWAGFEIIGRITLRHKKSGRIYK